MEVMPGYKRTEVGIIPNEWELATLSSVTNISTGNTPPTQNPANYGNDYLFVSPADLGNQKYITATEKKLSQQGFSISRRFPCGSILFTCIGSTIGKCGIAGVELTSNQQINALFPSPKVYGEFLYYALINVSPKIKALAGEQAVPIVNKTQFGGTVLAFPPLAEQRAIAAALSDIDGLIRSLDQLIASSRAIKQAAMQQLLTGKKRLPGFAGEWTFVTFGELASVRKERVDPKSSRVSHFCIEMEHIESASGRLLGNTFTETLSSHKSVFCEGDVLFGKLRAYLRKFWLADRLGVCSTEIWALTPNLNITTSKFVYQIVRTDQFIEVASTAHGTHMPRSDWGIIKNYQVYLPTNVSEQVAIAGVLSDMDAELDALERQREKTRALKQGMMQELLTGRTRLL